MSSARRNDLLMAGIAILVIVLDQLTKRWITQYFTAGTNGIPKPPIHVLGPVVQIQYLQNTGVAFSLLEGSAVLFLFIAVAVAVIATLYWRTRDSASLLLKLTFGLILGGAAGNLIDRFSHQYVVDFIHFQIPHLFDWPVFNVADSAISIGVVLLAFLLWRGETSSRPAPEPLTPPAATTAPTTAQAGHEHAPATHENAAAGGQRNTAGGR